MAQWGNTDQANNAPLYTVDAVTGDRGNTQFGNTVFAVDTEEMRVHPGGINAPGWIRVIDRGNGRTQYETLVAMSTIGGDAEDTVFPDPAAPENSVLSSITGTAQEGEVLTAVDGTWTGYPVPTYTYQWELDGVVIGGETSGTYTVVTGDVGSVIRVQVTATNSEGTANVYTANTTTVIGA